MCGVCWVFFFFFYGVESIVALYLGGFPSWSFIERLKEKADSVCMPKQKVTTDPHGSAET